MKKSVSLVLATMAVLAALVGVSSASAATEFGSGCFANEFFAGGEISVGHSAANPLPAAAPVSGVITEWKVAVGSFEPGETELPRSLFQELYVLRSSGTSQYLVVGKAESGPVTEGTVNSYGARIPVQVGDLLGLAGPATLSCFTPETADQTVFFRGIPSPGSVFPSSKPPFEGEQVPVIAKIEPDVDGDGYGDETQDKCPQSALYHEACPVVQLQSQPSVGAKAVNLSVASSLSAPVTVSATVGLGKGKKATLTAPGQTVAPGAIATFNLSLGSSVTKTLAALSKKKALTVTITASAPNITGAPSQSVTVAKLRGHSETAPKPKSAKK